MTTLLPARTEPEDYPEPDAFEPGPGEHIEPEAVEPDGDWLLLLVPPAAWDLIDALRRVQGAPTRSAVASDLLRRALSVEAVCR